MGLRRTLGVFAAAVAAHLAAAQTTSAAAPASSDTRLIQQIERTRTPSEAVLAYARALRDAADAPAVSNAFVRQVVRLGAPLLAETQALALLDDDPNNGFAWAVVGYASAARREIASAIEQLALAARFAAAEPFVQRTGGQILAWCDAQEDPDLGPTERRALLRIRSALGGRSAYAAAYREARRLYDGALRFDAWPAPSSAAPSDTGEYANTPPGSYLFYGGGTWYGPYGPVVAPGYSCHDPRARRYRYIYGPIDPYGYGYGYGYGGGYGSGYRSGYDYGFGGRDRSRYYTGNGGSGWDRIPAPLPATRGPLTVSPGMKPAARTPWYPTPNFGGQAGPLQRAPSGSGNDGARGGPALKPPVGPAQKPTDVRR